MANNNVGKPPLLWHKLLLLEEKHACQFEGNGKDNLGSFWEGVHSAWYEGSNPKREIKAISQWSRSQGTQVYQRLGDDTQVVEETW